MKLKDLAKGEYFTKKSIEYPTERQVFVKGDYDRSTKKYICCRFSNICDDQLLKGDTEVFTEFTF